MKKKTNTLSIIGIISAFFTFFISTTICLIAISQINKRKEKGKSLALIGIFINLLKVVLIIVLFTTFASNNTNSDVYKCKKATVCTYENETQSYNCTFNNNGVEEYLSCKEENVPKKFQINEKSSLPEENTIDDSEIDYNTDIDSE